jgi:hypothetical protein
MNTIKYFVFFNYFPTLTEIHTFLSLKTSKKALQGQLLQLVKNKMIRELSDGQRYTVGEYSDRSSKFKVQSSKWDTKHKISQKKIEKIKLFVKILSRFPQIKLIGLSGSLAMMNASEKDDIDLFIITSRNRLWTGRLISLIIAQLFNLRRLPGQILAEDKVCLNLFFDEKNLTVPKFKKTEYVGHEILQMHPLATKGNIYQKFLAANSWVFNMFPNAEKKIFNSKFLIFNQFSMNKFKILNYLNDKVESIAKKIQLHYINRHRTNEIITNNQLWFFPDDFEQKIINKQKP